MLYVTFELPFLKKGATTHRTGVHSTSTLTPQLTVCGCVQDLLLPIDGLTDVEK